MFDVGWPEVLVIAIVLIVVVGPKDLPRMLRTFGKTTSKMRSMAGDFRRQFDQALKEAELDEVKNLAAEARKLDPTAEIRKNLDPMRKMGDEIRAGLEGAMKSNPPKADAGAKTETGAAAPAATPAPVADPKPAATEPANPGKPDSASGASN
jgi:sec-independent protein translocase protein TatB